MSELIGRLRASVAARLRTDRETVEEDPTGRDLRVVPLALAAWAGAWAGTGWSPPVLLHVLILVLAAASAVGLLLVRSRRRRGGRLVPALRAARPRLVATLLVAVVVTGVAGVQAARLRSGPPAQLAADGALVTARLELRGDPRLLPGSGPRPPLLLVAARLDELTGRGSRWRLRTPVTVLVTGDQLDWWQQQPFGTGVTVAGRLQPAERGEAVAAVLRVRAPPTAVVPPGRGAQVVERVRAGLRQAVAARAPEPRALVPALVLGDTSRLTPELTDVFRTTGLTHLTAVSGANLTLLLAFLLLAARWVGAGAGGCDWSGCSPLSCSSPSAEPSRACCGPPPWGWLPWRRSVPVAVGPVCGT